MSLAVCIFAHNEERLLPECLTALEAAALNAEMRVFIMENGSSDYTCQIAEIFSNLHDNIEVVALPVADKANAWNEYVHRVAPEADCHIMLDGDIKPSPASFQLLKTALDTSPRAYAAAALPASGRSRRAWTARTLKNRYISGNLYALSKHAIEKFRNRNLHLPFGAVGEDGILTYLFRTDFAGGTDDSHFDRIAIATGAFFEFNSLGPSIRDLKTFQTRAKRYSERYFQKQSLFKLLKTEGVNAMPNNIREVYDENTIQKLKPRLDPFNYFVDRNTIKRLSRRHWRASVTESDFL